MRKLILILTVLCLLACNKDADSGLEKKTMFTLPYGALDDELTPLAASKLAMNDGFCAIKERELQNKIDSLLADNAVLRSTISENRQTERFLSAFNTLDTKITELAAKQPQTVPVQWPNLTAVNNTPFMGGYYGYGYQGNIWG